MSRLALFTLVLAGSLGCQSHLLSSSSSDRAVLLWEQGQQALKAGRLDDALTLYQQSLALDPGFTRNHLSIAAAFLQRGDNEGAALHLERYLSAHPNHFTVRGHYAELLHRLGRMDEAIAEYDRFDADAQELKPVGSEELIHCHSRLMELAEEQEDEYREHLHRGIGLFHLASEKKGDDLEQRQEAESLLCKAAGELTLARSYRPEEGRASLYLYEVWTRLDQRRPALRSLREAREAGPFSGLTPHEQGRLQTACRRHELPAAVR